MAPPLDINIRIKCALVNRFLHITRKLRRRLRIMAKYRKKPVIVEAEQYKPGMEDGFERDYDTYMCGMCQDSCHGCKNYKPCIQTLEGKHYISPGDYIITGIAGDRHALMVKLFKVIDNRTNKEADIEKIALEEEWAKRLVYCDMDGFYIGQDGSLILADKCGNHVFCDAERFRAVGID